MTMILQFGSIEKVPRDHAFLGPYLSKEMKKHNTQNLYAERLALYKHTYDSIKQASSSTESEPAKEGLTKHRIVQNCIIPGIKFIRCTLKSVLKNTPFNELQFEAVTDVKLITKKVEQKIRDMRKWKKSVGGANVTKTTNNPARQPSAVETEAAKNRPTASSDPWPFRDAVMPTLATASPFAMFESDAQFHQFASCNGSAAAHSFTTHPHSYWQTTDNGNTHASLPIGKFAAFVSRELASAVAKIHTLEDKVASLEEKEVAGHSRRKRKREI